MKNLPKRCNTKAIFTGLGRLVFPLDTEDGYDVRELRKAFCSFPALEGSPDACKERFNKWRTVERALEGRGDRELVAPIARHIAEVGGADGALKEALSKASSMSEVYSIISAALVVQTPVSSAVESRDDSFQILPSRLLQLSRGPALQRLAGTWVILRPSTQCAASQELLHVLDNGGSKLAQAVCLSDMGNVFEGQFVLAKDPVAYGTFCREVEGDLSFNMRSIYLSISADGQSDVATGYMLGKKDYSPTILASAPMLLARLTRTGMKTMTDAMMVLDDMRGKVGFLDIANGHKVLQYFGAARTFADNWRIRAQAASQRPSQAEAEVSNCPLIAPFLPDHGDMLALLREIGIRRHAKLAEELLAMPVESPSLEE